MVVLTSSEGPGKPYIKPIVAGQFDTVEVHSTNHTCLFRDTFTTDLSTMDLMPLFCMTHCPGRFFPLDAVSEPKKVRVYISLNIPPLILFIILKKNANYFLSVTY